MIDRHVRVCEGDFLFDGRVQTRGIAEAFAGREDVLVLLYQALLSVQSLTKWERHRLKVASHFMTWLGAARERGSSSPWARTGTSCAACQAEGLCQLRACDGIPAKKPVWHDKLLVVKVCPVLSFTPQVEEVLRVFYWTHDIVVLGNAVQWQQRFFPREGGLDDQEAWTMSALGYLRAVHNRLSAVKVDD